MSQSYGLFVSTQIHSALANEVRNGPVHNVSLNIEKTKTQEKKKEEKKHASMDMIGTVYMFSCTHSIPSI